MTVRGAVTMLQHSADLLQAAQKFTVVEWSPERLSWVIQRVLHYVFYIQVAVYVCKAIC